VEVPENTQSDKVPPPWVNWLAGWPHSQAARWSLVIALALLCLGANLPWNLDNYDQAKQAFVAYEIASGGDPFFQRTPRGDLATKPPLAGWIALPVYYVTGSWDVAWRLPGLIATALLFILLVRSAQKLLPEGGGWLVAAAFGLNMLTPRLATLVRTDMLLALFIAVCGLLILSKTQTRTPWQPREKWLFTIAMLGALMTKGPVIYAFLLPGMIAYICFAPAGQKNHVWSGWWTWVLPLAVFLCWGVAGLVTREEFYQQIVVEEFLSRFDQDLKSHERKQPLWFYFPHLLHKLLPWSALLLALPLFSRNVRTAICKDPATLWLACWAVGGILLMTLVPSKRVDRIFPVIPPLCLLLVAMVAACRCGTRVRAWCGATALFAAIFWVAYFVEIVRLGYVWDNRSLVRFGEQAATIAATHGEGRFRLFQGRDEGLVIYTGLTETTSASKVLREFREGQIDAFVAPVRRLPDGVELPEPALVSPKQHSKEVYHLYLQPIASRQSGT